jgi:hypothetical protein
MQIGGKGLREAAAAAAASGSTGGGGLKASLEPAVKLIQKDRPAVLAGGTAALLRCAVQISFDPFDDYTKGRRF